jgi:hypothetical protein
MIYDFCCIKRSAKEEFPDRYMPIERDQQGIWGNISSDFAYGVRYLPAMGICNLSYEAVTLDRYPEKVKKSIFNFVVLLCSKRSSIGYITAY